MWRVRKPSRAHLVSFRGERRLQHSHARRAVRGDQRGSRLARDAIACGARTLSGVHFAELKLPGRACAASAANTACRASAIWQARTGCRRRGVHVRGAMRPAARGGRARRAPRLRRRSLAHSGGGRRAGWRVRAHARRRQHEQPPRVHRGVQCALAVAMRAYHAAPSAGTLRAEVAGRGWARAGWSRRRVEVVESRARAETLTRSLGRITHPALPLQAMSMRCVQAAGTRNSHDERVCIT
jgi:hypothetical protein